MSRVGAICEQTRQVAEELSPQSLADFLTYGFLADDLTEDEYHYIEKVVQSTTAIQHKIQAPARKAANDNN